MNLGTRLEYDQQRSKAEAVLDAVMHVSTLQGGIMTSARQHLAVQVYTRITITAMTFIRLLPGNAITRDVIPPVWDWPSVASIARNIVEAYLMFYYIGLDPAPADEIDFRQQLLTYHHNWEKYRLYKEGSLGAEVLSEFEARFPIEKEKLKAHRFFGELDAPQRKRALDGQHPTYLTRDQLIGRLPFSTAEFKWHYRLLSNQVHTTPFSFQPTGNERGRGFDNPVDRSYIAIGIQLARKYLAASVLGMAEMFPTEIGKQAPEAVAEARSQFEELTTGVGGANT